MLSFLDRLYGFIKTPAIKKIAFIDGDQELPGLLKAYDMYVANTGTQTHLIRLQDTGAGEPKVLKRLNDESVNKIYLSGYTSGKEVVDKFIAGFIQKSITEGYQHITVISSDYDFIDIFRMAVEIEPAAAAVTFRMIVPCPMGRMKQTAAQIANIEVIKMTEGK